MKRYVHASSDNWIDWSLYEDGDDFDPTGEEFEEEIFDVYLRDPENEVNKELGIYPEPSIQGGSGSVFIFDESGQDRWDAYDISIDWWDWCDMECDMAMKAKNAEEYKQMYRKWMKEILPI